jgi:hypothetical protein
MTLRYLIAAAALAGAAAAPGATAAQSSLQQALNSKRWFTSYETARAESQRTGKPLMVVFRCEA